MGRRFKVWKFATMRKDSETTGTKDITVRNDPRVLPVGRVLRKTKLNELPQLVNVLKGDMSFVGWRPLTDRTFGWYPDDVKAQIVKTKPGLTGIGSIVFRDEESLIARLAPDAPERFYRDHIAPYKGELELWYQRHQSFWLDMKLILLTARVVLAPGKSSDQNVLAGLPPRPAALVAQPS
jgi:lipopolysaccharide/colanic/teichoic acid biosynthesis glycosyltransferase